MTSGQKRTVILAAVTLIGSAMAASRDAAAQITLGEEGGWKVTTDGRVNTFVSVSSGTGVPDGQPDFVGASTRDTADTSDKIHATRIRNGFMMSILGFTAQKQISPNFRVTARIGLWMNIGGSRTKNISALMDPRELYGQVEGNWGTFLAGSNLALFGRGGILANARIAHDYGMGYPCAIRDTSGGACGMSAFGAVFPGFEPGLVYTTPSIAGLQLAVGAFDPATIANGDLNRAPTPRVEAELKYDFRSNLRLFASGFWQNLEGTINDANGPPGAELNIQADAWGWQAGAMVSLGPVMVGGAGFEGKGFSPITYVDEHQAAVDSFGVLRRSRGGFGMAAIVIDAISAKVAGGYGLFQLSKTPNDLNPVNDMGMPQNPQLLRQNTGITVGFYQTTGPVRFALEYFRAEHVWYEFGRASANDPNTIEVIRPQQAVNFVNAGMTIGW